MVFALLVAVVVLMFAEVSTGTVAVEVIWMDVVVIAKHGTNRKHAVNMSSTFMV